MTVALLPRRVGRDFRHLNSSSSSSNNKTAAAAATTTRTTTTTTLSSAASRDLVPLGGVRWPWFPPVSIAERCLGAGVDQLWGCVARAAVRLTSLELAAHRRSSHPAVSCPQPKRMIFSLLHSVSCLVDCSVLCFSGLQNYQRRPQLAHSLAEQGCREALETF